MRGLAVVLATGVLGLFGCRGHHVSTNEFLSKGDAVCTAAAERIAALAVPRTPPAAAPQQFAGYVDDYVAEMRLELTNLRSIGYPEGQRAQLEADYQRLDDELDAAGRDPLGFRSAMLESAELPLRQAGLSACHV